MSGIEERAMDHFRARQEALRLHDERHNRFTEYGDEYQECTNVEELVNSNPSFAALDAKYQAARRERTLTWRRLRYAVLAVIEKDAS